MSVSIYKLASSMNKRVIPFLAKDKNIVAEPIPLYDNQDNFGKIKMTDTDQNISVIFPLTPKYDKESFQHGKKEQIGLNVNLDNRQLITPLELDRKGNVNLSKRLKDIKDFVFLATKIIFKAINQGRYRYEKQLCRKMPAISNYLNELETEIDDKDMKGIEHNKYEYLYVFSVDYMDKEKHYPSSIRMSFDSFDFSEDNYVDFYIFYNDKNGQKVVGTAGTKNIKDKNINEELVDKKIDMVKRIIISYCTKGINLKK